MYIANASISSSRTFCFMDTRHYGLALDNSDIGPECLTSLVTPNSLTRPLTSTGQRQLTISRYHLERYGRRSFSMARPAQWNNLPPPLETMSQWQH